MQLRTNVSYHFFKYNKITTNWDIIKNFIDISGIVFTCQAAINLYYSLFRKFVKDFSYLSIFNTAENLIIDTYYGQYSEFMESFYLISNCNYYKKDIFDVDQNNIWEAIKNGVANDNNDQKKSIN